MGQAIFSLILVLLISSTKEIEAKAKRQISGESVPFRKQAFRFGYTIKDQRHGTQFRQEEGDHRGVVQGSYGYHDPYGIYRQVEYIADALGFRARIRSNEPGLGQQDPANVEIVKTGLPLSVSLHHRAGPVSNDHIAIFPASSNRNAIKVKDVLRPAESTRVVKPSDGLFESTRQTIKVHENDKKENDKNIISVLFSNKSQKSKKKKYVPNIQRAPEAQFKKVKIKPVKQEVIIEYPQNLPEKPQSIIQFSQQLPESPVNVKFPQNPAKNSQKGVEYFQNVSENPQNPLSYIQNNPEIQNIPEIVEVAVDRPVPIPYLVQNSGKQQPEIDVIKHPSDPDNKYSSNVYHFSNPENQQDDRVVMVEQLPDIHSQPSINHYPQLESKQGVEPQYQTEARVPVVIIKNQPNEPHADFGSSMQETNKLPFVILKEVSSPDQISESTNNNIRPVASFVFGKDLKTSQTTQKIQCPIACFTPSVINGEKERRYQQIPCFAIQQ